MSAVKSDREFESSRRPRDFYCHLPLRKQRRWSFRVSTEIRRREHFMTRSSIVVREPISLFRVPSITRCMSYAGPESSTPSALSSLATKLSEGSSNAPLVKNPVERTLPNGDRVTDKPVRSLILLYAERLNHDGAERSLRLGILQRQDAASRPVAGDDPFRGRLVCEASGQSS